MATIVHPDGTKEVVTPKDRINGFTLSELRSAIGGGYIEIVHPKHAPHGTIMVVDEEGLLKGLPYNPYGSYLYGGFIVGIIVIANNREVQ